MNFDQSLQFDEVPIFQDRETSSSNSSTNKAQITKKIKKWLFVETLASREKALESLKAYGKYAYRRHRQTKEGKKEEYRCNMVKIRGPQCDSAIQLLYQEEDLTVSLYKTNAEHTHEAILEQHARNGIPQKTKILIEEYIKLKIVISSRIIEQLEEAKKAHPNIVIPTLKQIYSFKNNKSSTIPSK